MFLMVSQNENYLLNYYIKVSKISEILSLTNDERLKDELNSDSIHSEEITDDESYLNESHKQYEFSEFFEENKNQILQILPNLKIGMDLTKVD